MNMPLPPLQKIPADIASVADYEAHARERMTPQAWAYLNGASADETTLQDNLAAFKRLKILPRVLQDLSGANTRLQLLDMALDHPLLLAPVAYQRLAHPQGELATALAASAMKAAMVVSTQASVALEDIAAQAQAPLWFQLYIQPDRGFTRALVQRAEAAGYRALVLTVDAPVNGVRNREQRAGFQLPPDVSAVNLHGMAHPTGHTAAAGDSPLFGSALAQAAPVWRDIAWLQSITSLPVLLKGVLSPLDATLALEHGVAGLIVSNHGGRTLDGVPATIDALPAIAHAVQGRLPLLLDGGIRRGTDVFKALALGADAVLIGRPAIWGLAAAGPVGVVHMLHLLRAELEVAMALAGTPTLASITPAALWRHAA